MRSRSISGATAADPGQCLVTVCRGCCCGDRERYPGIDHEGLVTDLEARVGPLARVRIVDCLLSCQDANIVVVSPTPRQRRNGVKPVWLARIFEVSDNDLIAQWLSTGGPGSPVPTALRSRLTAPFLSRRRGRAAQQQAG